MASGLGMGMMVEGVEKYMSSAIRKSFTEAVILSDDQDWVWEFARQNLHRAGFAPLRLPSSVSLKDSRGRLDTGRPIVIDWGCRLRPAGAVVEELSEIFGGGDISDRVVIVAANVLREDALYFGELGITRFVVLRNRDVELAAATREFLGHWQSAAIGLGEKNTTQSRSDAQWRSLLRRIDTATDHFWEKLVARRLLGSKEEDFATASSVSAERALTPQAYEALIERARGFIAKPESGGVLAPARVLDLEASLFVLVDKPHDAVSRWSKACEVNPNYHRAHINLSRCLRHLGRFEEALAIIQRKQEQNRQSIHLMVEIGDIHLEASDLIKAEHHYQLALDRDSMSSTAMNGMAQVKFATGDFPACRDLLARSRTSARAAARFNTIGIELVKAGRYEEALELYGRAQFVLPQQEKGPMLFYNMGLCYWRWGRHEIARDFIKLALIKDPAYQKAKSLLFRIESGGMPQSTAS